MINARSIYENSVAELAHAIIDLTESIHVLEASMNRNASASPVEVCGSTHEDVKEASSVKSDASTESAEVSDPPKFKYSSKSKKEELLNICKELEGQVTSLQNALSQKAAENDMLFEKLSITSESAVNLSSEITELKNQLADSVPKDEVDRLRRQLSTMRELRSLANLSVRQTVVNKSDLLKLHVLLATSTRRPEIVKDKAMRQAAAIIEEMLSPNSRDIQDDEF